MSRTVLDRIPNFRISGINIAYRLHILYKILNSMIVLCIILVNWATCSWPSARFSSLSFNQVDVPSQYLQGDRHLDERFPTQIRKPHCF